MEGMVNDLALAREKQQAFEDWMKNSERKLKIDFNVTVLTTGFWPSYKVRGRGSFTTEGKGQAGGQGGQRQEGRAVISSSRVSGPR